MLFNSWIFLLLLTLTLLFYYLPYLRKSQIYILIASSLIFYSYNYLPLVLLLLASAGINIVTSYYVVYKNPKYRKLTAIIGVVSNLFVLGFFKYSGLFARTFLVESGDLSEFLVSIPLPIGISFFTFQGISLSIDVFKENYFKGEEVIPKSFKEHSLKTLFYISFFPQLVAGPIVKAHDFLPQIKTKYLNEIDFELCFKNLVLGYFLKMVVADNLKDFTFWIEYPYFQYYESIDLIMMLFGYSCQIFADFAGYSLIAIGLAGLFGYKLRDNFYFPYVASSFRDFWKRWHISLSSFLMEYLYFPLGGSKKGKFRTYLNLFIVMALGGLWHGAAWSYMVWGFAHGIFLAIERMFFNVLKINSKNFGNVFYSVFIFIMVTFAWLLFKLPEFSHVILYVEAIFENFSFSFDTHLFFHILLYSLPVVVYHAFYLFKTRYQFSFVTRLAYLFYGIMLFLIISSSGSAGEFIYFQF